MTDKGRFAVKEGGREGGEREGWPIKQRNDINQLGSTEVGDREIVPEPN